jgi:hypothetical protein
MRLPEILFLLITDGAMCSAIHSSAVDTGTVIGLIIPTLMKVVSDNKADSKRAFTLSPHQPIRFQNILIINIRVSSSYLAF